jgi:agmatine/peptidylarginine deiminase
MINDYQTNVVYLADGIRHYMPLAVNLLNALEDAGVETHLLRHTESSKHIWVRDFMPLQMDENRFLQYRYAPDYLKNDPDYMPLYETICRGLHLRCKQTKLVIDGGNVVKCGERVIMTDKVFKENPDYTPECLRRLLEEAFECEVCIIPWDRYEIFGHADGMVRSIGDNCVLMNNYIDLDKSFREKLKGALEVGGFHVEELHYDVPRPSKQSWAYLNFLQVKNNIFVPGLSLREDELAVEQIQKYYPHHKVVLVPDCLNLVMDGGALNCISWNVLCNEQTQHNDYTENK